MIINIAFRHMPHSDEIKEYLEKRISKISRLLKEPIEVRATFKHEKFRYDLTLRIKSQWFNFNVIESGTDWKTVIDNASASIDNIARKERERLKERKKVKKLFLPPPIDETVLKSEPENKERIKEKVIRLKPISLQEAIEELKSNNNNFIVYLDDTSNSVRVMHKKSQNVIEILIPELA